MIQAVILAAGRGTRMGDLTNNIPKPMLFVDGKPILEHILNNLPEEVSEIIFVIGHKGELIKDYFGDSYNGKDIKYVEQKDLNGTAGAVHCAKDLLNGKFLVLNGDNFYHHSDLKKFINYDLGVLTKEVDNPCEFGIVKTDENGNLLEIIEKPTEYVGNLANIGAYVLNKKFFNYDLVKKKVSDKEYGLPQTLARMAKDYKVKVGKADMWHPIEHPENILTAEEVVKKFTDF
jgi:NDP-sugar pyrophosphorylase family protein